MNYSKLLGRIRENHFTLNEVADRLDISLSTFRRKLYLTGEFTRDEINRLAEILKMNNDELIDVFFTE